MIILKLATNGLDLIKLETSLVTSDNKKSVSLEVTFDDSWTGYGKSATFKSSSSDKIYEVPLADNACVVPWEVLESVGTMSVGVRGVKDDGSVIASDLVDYKIAQGAKTGDGTSEDPTPTVYEQLLSNYSSVDQKITVERKRIDNIVKLPSGSTSGDAELIDIRIGADGNTYNSAGTAVREQVSELKDDLDTLNQGGLNLKEDFIGQQVNEWLDEHPEATTTVQDGSLTEAKMHPDFLPYIKNGYVTPEMFGAKGDGVTDDTLAIQNAIDSCDTNKLLKFDNRKVYKIKTLSISQEIIIDLGGSEIIGTDGVMIEYNVISPNGRTNITNGSLNGNHVANIISGSGKSILLDNIIAMNPYNVAFDFSDMYEVIMTKCYLRNSENDVVGIISRADNMFENIILRGFKVALRTTGSSRFTNVHAWLDDSEKLIGSIYCDDARGFFTNCFTDTYEIGFNKTDDSNLVVNSHLFHCNPVFYKVPYVNSLPYAFKFKQRNNSKNVFCVNSRCNNLVGDASGLGESGYNMCDIDSSDLVGVFEFLSTYVKNKNNFIRLALPLLNENSGSAYCTIVNNICTLYFNITLKDTPNAGTYYDLFKLPELVRPYDTLFVDAKQRDDDNNMVNVFSLLQSSTEKLNFLAVNNSKKVVGNISYPLGGITAFISN